MNTDTQVLREVIAAFDQRPGLRSSRLYIDVQSRIVTVRGRVNSMAERDETERTVRGIVGMRALVLEVAVASTSLVHAV
jgi:osmotically-inducible protein OsmY